MHVTSYSILAKKVSLHRRRIGIQSDPWSVLEIQTGIDQAVIDVGFASFRPAVRQLCHPVRKHASMIHSLYLNQSPCTFDRVYPLVAHGWAAFRLNCPVIMLVPFLPHRMCRWIDNCLSNYNNERSHVYCVPPTTSSQRFHQPLRCMHACIFTCIHPCVCVVSWYYNVVDQVESLRLQSIIIQYINYWALHTQ